MTGFFVSLLWLLAMAAAALHLRDGGRSLGNGVRIAGAAVVVLPLALWLSPQPNWIGVLLAGGAILRVITGPLPRAGGLLAGASAALGAALLLASGVSPLIAIPMTAAGIVAAFLLGGRTREGALVVVAVLMVPVGLVNDLAYGWRSAMALAGGQAEPAAVAAPSWAMALTITALLAGVMKGLWFKR